MYPLVAGLFSRRSHFSISVYGAIVVHIGSKALNLWNSLVVIPTEKDTLVTQQKQIRELKRKQET
jgi:hypothetical protein